MAEEEPNRCVAWELFAIMEDDKCVGVIAKNPNRPQAIDILEDVRALLAEPQAPIDE